MVGPVQTLESIQTAGIGASTVRVDRDLPIQSIGAASGLLWRREGRVLAGIGRAAELRLDRPGGFGPAVAALAAIGEGALAFAALPFAPDEPGRLIIPEIIVGIDRSGHRWLTSVGPDPQPVAALQGLLADVESEGAKGSTDGMRLFDRASLQVQPTDYRLRSVLAPETWRDEVVVPVRDRIRSGELTKTVLARELRLETDHPIDVSVVVDRLGAAFPRAILFSVDGFFGASPELLVAREGDVVRAHPLAGTAAKASDPAIDQKRIARLLASDKDRYEHSITIDWLIDNLLAYCSYADAEPEPSIVTMANVHHLGTLVEGRLSSPPASILELVAALHPTPAVGGSPQKEALALIAEMERADRGRYAGPVGWVDAEGNGEFAVGLRSAEVTDEGARFFAGVGVVEDSDPDAELAETRAKFRAMLGALIVP